MHARVSACVRARLLRACARGVGEGGEGGGGAGAVGMGDGGVPVGEWLLVAGPGSGAVPLGAPAGACQPLAVRQLEGRGQDGVRGAAGGGNAGAASRLVPEGAGFHAPAHWVVPEHVGYGATVLDLTSTHFVKHLRMQ